VVVLARKLEYLIALAKEGHFARAAAACHVSQPALSAGIQQLEHELGVPIVKRGQRFQGFTEQGDIVLNWAQRMEMDCKNLRQELRDRTNHLAGTLRIGVLNSTTPFLSIFMIPFSQRFPEVNLKVMNHNPFDIQQGLEDFAFDMAISYLDDKRRYRFSHTLYTQEYYLLTRKRSRFSPQGSVSWEDVKSLPLCLFPAETHVFGTEVYETLGGPHPGVARVETNAMMILLDHVRTGNWASILPKPVLFMIAGSDEFEAVPLPLTSDAGAIGIGVPHREPESYLAEAFFELATSSEVLGKFHEFFQPSPAATRR
jgi:DNA-binding transcriptional LysR family regulator